MGTDSYCRIFLSQIVPDQISLGAVFYDQSQPNSSASRMAVTISSALWAWTLRESPRPKRLTRLPCPVPGIQPAFLFQPLIILCP